jgi:Carboxypeptidase regulatory-like domain/TonB dependent receptor
MRSVVGFVVLCLVLVPLAFSQSQLGTGAINGSVTDPQGRAVEGAQVKVVNADTGLERDLKTGSEGQFTVPVLPTGEYTVSIKQQGFAPFRQERVKVTVGESASVLASLKVGSVEEVVEVKAPAIDTVKTDTSSDVDSTQIQNLPLNGRRVDQLALLTPGVTRSGTFGLLSYNGMAPAFNNYMVEGNDNNQAYFAEGRGRTRIATNISEDAIQEFQVGQSNFLAEFGGATGGSINAVIRSGTNALHGDGFWYYRNQDFGATDPFAINPLTNLPFKPDETRHQFGGAVGGPIKQNKLFFFLSFDAQLRDFPLLTSDTSNALNLTGTNSQATPCAPPVPAANQAACTAGQNFLLAEFPGGAPGHPLARNFNHYLGLAKIDWTLNRANTLSVSYNHLTHSAANGIQTALVLGNVGGNGSDDVRLENLNGRLTTVISSNVVNEFRTQWGRDFEFEFANMPPPNVSVGGFSYGRATFLQRAADPDERHEQLVDNISWIKGKHAFKFGGEYNRIRDIINNPSNFGGAYIYQDVLHFGQDLLNPAGQAYSSFSQSFGLGAIDFSTNQYGFFAQDQWKILKNVTINYGLRYDYQALPSPVAPNPAIPNTLAFNSDRTNFGPRVGVAWDLASNGKSVIRAGYGMFFAMTPMGTIDNALRETGLNDPTKSLLNVTLFPGNPGAPLFPNVLSAAASASLFTFQLDPNFQRPRAQEINAGFEQEVARDTTITFTYVYTKGGRLPLNFVTNMPAPAFTRTFQLPGGSTFTVPFVAVPATAGFARNTVLESVGESWYQAFMVEIRRRFVRDFEAHAAFTASKAMNQTGTGFGDGSAPEGPFGGGSLFDQFNLTSARDATSQPRRLVIDGVWFLPYGRSGKEWYNPLIRGFSVSGLTTLETGRPYATGISAGSLPFCVGGTLPNCAGGQKFLGLGGVLGQGGLSILPTVPRNNVTGRPNYRLDTRVARSFRVTERFQFQVLAEAFNLFNHSNFTGYNTTAFAAGTATLLNSTTPIPLTARSNFGVPSQDGGQPDGTGARRLQLGLRLNF